MDIGLDFRNEMLQNNDFRKKFTDLTAKGYVEGFPLELFDVIRKHKTSIVVGGEPLSFLDIFNRNLNKGRCRECSIELTLLLDKLGFKVRLIQGHNKYFKGTANSYFGGHYWLEILIGGRNRVVDTSLMIMADKKTVMELGHVEEKEHKIDDLLKDPEIMDYYENLNITN